jgi:hypothetical protein
VGANGGSRLVGGGYDETHTIHVRAIDTENQVSAEASKSATTEKKPEPRAWVTRGSSAQGQDNCSSAACAYFVINTQDFPAGSYTLSCESARDGQFTDGKTYTLGANASQQMTCYYGYGGDQVWVNISGYGESEHRAW